MEVIIGQPLCNNRNRTRNLRAEIPMTWSDVAHTPSCSGQRCRWVMGGTSMAFLKANSAKYRRWDNQHGAKQLIVAIRIFRNLPTGRPTSPTLGRSSWISLVPPPPFPHSGAGQDSVLLNSFFTDVRFPHFVLVQQLMCRIWIHPSIHPHAPPSHDTSESGSRTCLTVHAR